MKLNMRWIQTTCGKLVLAGFSVVGVDLALLLLRGQLTPNVRLQNTFINIVVHQDHGKTKQKSEEQVKICTSEFLKDPICTSAVIAHPNKY